MEQARTLFLLLFLFLGLNFTHSLTVSLTHSLTHSLTPLQDLDTTVKTLLQKCGESNAFIREDIIKTLGEVVQNVSPSKSMLAFIAGGVR